MLGFPGGSDGKESAFSAGASVRSLSREDPLEKEMATHSSTLSGESHGGRSLVGYSPQVAKSGTQLSDFTFIFSSSLTGVLKPSERRRASASVMLISGVRSPCYVNEVGAGCLGERSRDRGLALPATPHLPEGKQGRRLSSILDSQ